MHLFIPFIHYKLLVRPKAWSNKTDFLTKKYIMGDIINFQ